MTIVTRCVHGRLTRNDRNYQLPLRYSALRAGRQQNETVKLNYGRFTYN